MSDEEITLTAEQEAALTTGHNIAITAGAGTGKTYTVTNRYRRLLRNNPSLRPTNILMLTFTNDATHELREKIRGMVENELESASGEAYDRWRAVKDDIADAYIHTIHGFCSRVLREFAVEADVHPDFETLDEGASEHLISTAITTVIDQYATPDTSDPGKIEESIDIPHNLDKWHLPAELETLSRLYTHDQLKATLSSLFAERPVSTQWADRWADESPSAYENFLRNFIDLSITKTEARSILDRQDTKQAVDTLQNLAEMDLPIPESDNGMATLTSLSTYLNKTQAHIEQAPVADQQRLLLLVADAVTTNDGRRQSQTWRYAGTASTWNENGCEAEHELLKTALDSLADILQPETRNLDHDPVVMQNGATLAIALARVFQCVRLEYAHRKQSRTALDYSDLISQTITLLQTDDTTRHRLQDQFGFIMVDEIQDTDPRQWKLLTLVSGEEPDQFDGHNVCMVGDAKQSIYRFRDADVTQFNAGRRKLLNDNPDGYDGDLELSTNFRTADSTLTVINDLFADVFQPLSPEAQSTTNAEFSSYEAKPQRLTANRQEGTDITGSVEYLLIPADAEADMAFGLADSWYTERPFVSTADREARAVAARLTRLFAENTTVYDPANEAYTPVKPKHVAVLFRSSTRMAAFERAFAEQDIPFTNLKGSGFYDTPEVQPLISLLKVFENPHDDIAVYGVLRSPLFGFADDTLTAAHSSEVSLWDGLTKATPILQEARVQIEQWRKASGSGSHPAATRWSALFSQIIDETGYFLSIGAGDRSRQAIANVEKFREQLRTWEEAQARSVTALLDRIEQDQSTAEDPSEATIPGEIEGIQLRTVHSAKGLEFPVVVVPELTREFYLRSSLPRAYIETIHGDAVLGIRAPGVENPFEIQQSAAYQRVKEHYEARERAEYRRQLYVAVTRVRDHLILSGTHHVDETESGLEPVGDWKKADSWRDWVQPTLLSDANIVSTIASKGFMETTTDGGCYTIRRPEPPISQAFDRDEQPIPTTIDTPTPSQPAQQYQNSATELREQLASLPNRPPVLQVENQGTQDEEFEDRVTIDEMSAAEMGSIVHKLCELDPPENEWLDVVRRVVDEPSKVSPSVLDALRPHVQTAQKTLDRLEKKHQIRSRHSEVMVQANIGPMRVSGIIDHLVETDNGYLVVDYKTNDLSSQSVDMLTDRYLLQLIPYAAAVFQADNATTSVTIALIFTDAGILEQRTLTGDDLETIQAWVETNIPL